MGCRGVRGALGAGRECRYSGASRGIGGIRGLLGVHGDVRGHQLGTVRGVLEAWQGSVGYSGLQHGL